MAYNVISFTEKKDADRFVEKHTGKNLSSKQLADHKWDRHKEPMGKENNESGHSH
nr:hypothetical protein GGBNIMDK_00002 [Bacillus cereus]WLE91163.1 hypothetical protein GGBNIMDK_00194 [Bacillus cereus]